MAMLWQDIRYASRRLSKSPGLTAVAILSLTFGIGANSAIFSLMDALMMRPLSVRQPESLIELTTVGKDGQQSGMSLPIFQELARRQQVFSGLFAWFGDSVFNVEANGVLSQGNVCMVTGDFYSDLGVSPILGRLFGPHE